MQTETAIAQPSSTNSSDIDWYNEMMIRGASVSHVFVATRKQASRLAASFGAAIVQEQDELSGIFNLGLISAPGRGKSHFSDWLVKHGGRFQLAWQENENNQFEGYSEAFGSVVRADCASGDAIQSIGAPDAYADRHRRVYKGLDIVEHPWCTNIKTFHTLVKITGENLQMHRRRYEFFITPELEQKPSFQGFVQSCRVLKASA